MDSNCSVAVVFKRGLSGPSLVSLHVWVNITADVTSERVWVPDRAMQLVNWSQDGDEARARQYEVLWGGICRR
jgi:hypothetical protein